jgi:hypothetical protein
LEDNMARYVGSSLLALLITGFLYSVAGEAHESLPNWAFEFWTKLLVFLIIVGAVRFTWGFLSPLPNRSPQSSGSELGARGRGMSFWVLMLAIVICGVFYTIASHHINQVPQWVFSWWTRILMFVVLVGLLKMIWNVGKIGRPERHEMASKRMELDRDVRWAFGSRMREAGENLAVPAAQLANRGRKDLAQKAIELRERARLLGDRMLAQPAGPDPTGTGALSRDRAGQIVEFDKRLLALAEETADHAVEISGGAANEPVEDLQARLDHLDETLTRLGQHVQARDEMLRGIR